MVPYWRLSAYYFFYFAFIGGSDTVSFSLRLVDSENPSSPIFSSHIVVNFAHADAVEELAFFHPEVTFPRAGKYRMQLLVGDQIVRERLLVVWKTSFNGHLQPSK